MKRIFILFLFAWVFLPAMVLAVDYGGVGGKPAHPDPNIPHSSQWFIYTLQPGESKDDELIVTNNSSQPVDVMLYPADSTPSTDGGFALKQLVEPKTDVGVWIALSQSQIHLQAGEVKAVPFRLSVPADPKLDVGDHTGGILIQKVQQDVEHIGGMEIQTRVGVRVYVTIPGEVVRKIEIDSLRATLDEARKVYVVSAAVKNSGNTSQDVTIKTRVTNEWPLLDRFFKNFPLDNERHLQVLRDSSLISNYEFPKPLFGKLQATASVGYDRDTKVLTAEPVVVYVPLDRNLLILCILAIVFIISLITLVVMRKHGSRKTKKTGRKKIVRRKS